MPSNLPHNHLDGRRRSQRQRLEPPEVCLLHFLPGPERTPALQPDRIFVDLLDRSPEGGLVKSVLPIAPGTSLLFQSYDPDEKSWLLFRAEVKHLKPDPFHPHSLRIGLAFLGPAAPAAIPAPPGEKRTPGAADYEFFRGIELLKRLHRDAVCPLLNRLRFHRIRAGERLIRQGDAGDACYVIQRGSCGILVEKNGEAHRVAVRQQGDILGEMALVTGEPRNAHVDAETEMELWRISREDFDRIAQDFPELRGFLTEIIAARLAASHLTADRKIGKYTITDIIGRGGYSIVYKGTHATLNMPVVVKMLHHDMAMDPRFIQSFEREARIIAQFNHDNIIKVYDIESLYQTVFIVMEYIEGRPLRQILQEVKRLPAEQAIHCLLQVSSGLHYAHERGIIHQDIKPGNIFVLPNGRVKILDFGLAAPCGTESAMTGTPYYMSPEQVDCLPVDERADIYALGVTAYEMLAGCRPFPEDDPHAVMEMHVSQDIPDPADRIEGLHGGLRALLMKCCARDPEQRYRNIPDLLRDLHPLAEELSVRRVEAGSEHRKAATVVVIYRGDQQLKMKQLLEQFTDKARKAGILVKAAEFGDI